MSKKDSLGDRMKKNYEKAYNIKLPMRMPVIIRLDGKAFHTYTKGMDRPYDDGFMKLMDNTAKYLCKNVQCAQIAYVQSDEISILIHNYKKLSSQSFFGNEVQKIVSITAAMASSYFSVNAVQIGKTGCLAQFDSRVFVLPESEVCNYFIWRQQDWERNSIQLLAQSLYSHNELHKKNNSQLQDMCWEKGVNWNDLKPFLKRGRSIVYSDESWGVDFNMPILTKDRGYIERLLDVDDEQ